jgi:hypothetical protein
MYVSECFQVHTLPKTHIEEDCSKRRSQDYHEKVQALLRAVRNTATEHALLLSNPNYNHDFDMISTSFIEHAA